MGEEGGRRGLRGIIIGTEGVGCHKENSVVQRRHVVTLWHLTMLMDSDCSGMWWGLNNMGKCSNHNVSHVKPS